MTNKILSSLVKEEEVCQSFLHMTSYENRLSNTASSFLSSDLGNRYHLSTPSSHNGSDISVHIAGFNCRTLSSVHQLELEAHSAVQTMFNASHAELRLVSGVHATLSTIAAMTEPGQIVYSIAPEDGGHFATKHVVESLGRNSKYIPWDTKNLNIDLTKTQNAFKKDFPSMVFLDHGTPLFNLPVSQLKEMLPPEGLLVYDASHTLGLIAGGYFQKPLLEGADVIQGNTHKTFPGPQKAMVLFKNAELGARYSDSISLGLVSSQHTHHTIALGITILEMQKFGTQYAGDMLNNAQHLGEKMMSEGLGLVSHNGIFTTSHELLINKGWFDNYLQGVDRLFNVGISVNGRIAFSQPTIRIGVQEITRRGMSSLQMTQIAKIFKLALQDSKSVDYIQTAIAELNQEFDQVFYSFDQPKASLHAANRR
ncbi:hypothetical protein [Marinomonas sp. THO17]|uniref:hypothetical protein n=1 Tax=Marinomonas sp. THO17 TaxID=3149048 RepID=UPI00336BCCE9